MTVSARPVAALLGLLAAVAALWAAAPPPLPRPRPVAPVAAPPERPELAVLRCYARLNLSGMDPEALLPLRAAIISLDRERRAKLLTEHRGLDHEAEPLEQLEFWLDRTSITVWAVRKREQVAGWVVFEGQTEIESKERQHLRFTYLDSCGTVRVRAALATGWRQRLDYARLDEVAGYDGPVVLIVVKTSPFFIDPRREWWWYAIVGDKFERVRQKREDDSGTRTP